MLITAKILIAYNTDIARTCTCRPNNEGNWIPGRYLSLEKYDFQLTLVAPDTKYEAQRNLQLCRQTSNS